MNKTFLLISAVVLANIFFAAIIYLNFSCIGTDGAFYAWLAKNLAEGRGLTLGGDPHVVFSPGLPIFIAVIFYFIKNLEFASYLTVIFFGIASLPLFYLLAREFAAGPGRKFSDKNVLLIAGASLLFFGFNGYFIWQRNAIVNAQVVAIFFSILFSLALLKVSYLDRNLQKKDLFWLFLVGFSLGLAYLIRPEYFFMIFPALAYIIILYRKIFSGKRIFICLFLIFAGFMVLASPYLLFLHKNLGAWMINGRTVGMKIQYDQKTHDLDQAATPENGWPNLGFNKFEASDVVPGGIVGSIFGDFPFFIKNYLGTFLQNEGLLARGFGFLGVIFFGLGLLDFILRKKFREIAVAGISGMPFFVYAMGEDLTFNYLSPIFYVLILFMASGIFWFTRSIAENFKLPDFKRKAIFWATTAIVSFYFFIPFLQNLFFLPEDYSHAEYKLIGAWIKKNIPGIENEVVLTRKPEISFYAGSKWEEVPYVQTFSELEVLMRQYGMKYLVADNRYFNLSRPQFTDLLNPAKAPSQFKLIKKISRSGREALLYKLSN